jgi:hypothetical protein
MQQFIPFEDDWDALENLRPEALIPYRVGLLGTRDSQGQRTALTLPAIFSSVACTSLQRALPTDSSST